MNGLLWFQSHTLFQGPILAINKSLTTTRHGTITGFKVYRGLEKSRFQNHKNSPLFCFRGLHSFLTCRQRLKVQDSLSCVQ